MSQGLLKLLVDFRQDARQVPSGDIPSRSLSRTRPLGEAPTVTLKVLPIPVGENSVHHGNDFLGSLCHLSLHPGDLLLGFVSLNGSLQVDLLGNGSYGHGIGFFLEGSLDERIELFNGRFRETLLGCLLHFLPLANKAFVGILLADEQDGKGKKQGGCCDWYDFLHGTNQLGDGKGTKRPGIKKLVLSH